ncbi:unnamed protein product [Bursaphelenchus okinawaensis]|uniref:Structural maintenance of chromosomes protein 3 n=1 Tax=Bursaphelenchus okinawaensis TaxID=465554 RepID=A0A811K8A3_9BILA|nr:unnamed protein product [Bursaphelenchus okinawaensis]CAG9094822.1 unnamed protein product [Bursaphelenchus okinawaensis]
MFIKEINITGFRSYKELTTIKDFSPKHNVVVGRNGSGKSNFFFAIQFVLSNEFNNLNQEQRNNLLHEGTGQRAPYARVEIVFDNTLRRLPSENNEVRIARQVSTKKDQYFIDNKTANRTDIMNLLESAGISRSNPYFIVKQGKVMELATQTDAQRLKLIREVAGTRVFDERKEQSVKLLKDTQEKLEKCQSLLGLMEDRLKKLEEEKEDLKEYQKYDKMKRAIEYTINDLESNECRLKSDKLAAKREDMNSKQNSIETEMMAVQQSILNTQSLIKRLESQFKGVKDQRDALMSEQQDLLTKKARLELTIKDLQEEIDRERNGRNTSEQDLKKLKSEIQKKQDELELLEPEYKTLVEEETRLMTDIKINEQKVSELNAKLGQKDVFQSAAERDKFLKTDINKNETQINLINEQVKNIMEALEEDEVEVNALNEMALACERELREKLSEIERVSQQLAEKRRAVDRLSGRLKDAQFHENAAIDELTQAQKDIENSEDVLMSLAPKNMQNGIRSINLVLKWMSENNHDGRFTEVLDGYYGKVLDHVETDPVYFLAADVTAQNRLFHHIVKNDRVAMKILDQLNSRELPGTFEFMPLNRLIKKQNREAQTGEATSLLNVLRYPEEYDPVYRQIFASIAVVRDLQAGARISRSFQMNCVTINGEQVDRRGPMTGGYLDRKRSKMEAASGLRENRKVFEVAEEKVKTKHQEARLVLEEYEKLNVEYNTLDEQLKQLKSEHQTVNEKKYNISEQINKKSMGREPKTAQIVQLKERVRRMEARKEMLAKQLGTALESQLTSEERSEMNALQEDIKKMRKELSGIAKKRSEKENRKHQLENQLRTNLIRRRDDIESKIQDISIEEKRYRLNAENAQVKQLNERLNEIMKRINELNETFSDYNKDKDGYEKELEENLEKKNKFDSQIEAIAKQTDTYCTKIADYQAKREEFMKKMNEIGIVSADALGKYRNCSLKELDKKLTQCMTELKKYQNVNKKALDQFVRASNQKDSLTKSLEELAKNEESINNLITTLNSRKQETLTLTFRQISRNFKEVFHQLIPDGSAQLIIQKNDAAESQSSQSQEENEEDFVGVSMRVCFTGAEETKEMNHLSGGQKSLVALALIFSIQKCDPAPFYLFDEVDAALDRQHRQSVATMIHELSENAQFITTTFRPELLEHAENFYGVRFRNKVSYIDPTTKEEAYDFLSMITRKILRNVGFRSLRRYSSAQEAENKDNRSLLLKKFIKDKIKVSGPITVHEYMKLASGSAAGFYTKKADIFGASGDFITAPEISQMFGELIGIWIYNELWNSGERGDWQLVELGPGTGALMSDVLRTLNVLKVGKVDIVHTERLTIRLVEVSDHLIDQQELRLCGRVSKPIPDSEIVRKNKTKEGIPIYWHRELNDVPKQQFSVFVGNEFLDVLPVHLFEKLNNDWREVQVTLNDEEDLCLMLSRSENIHSKGLIPEWIRDDPTRDKWELNPDAGRNVTEIAQRITEFGGFGLFIDYGHDGGRRTRSLRAYHKHKIVDVLSSPGLMDLTADVDFGYLRKILEGICLTYGPTTQREFLVQMGIRLRTERLLQSCKDEKIQHQLKAGYKALVDDSEDGMGVKFHMFSMFPNTLKPILDMRGGFPAGFFPNLEEVTEDLDELDKKL